MVSGYPSCANPLPRGFCRFCNSALKKAEMKDADKNRQHTNQKNTPEPPPLTTAAINPADDLLYTSHRGTAIRKMGVLSMNLLEYYPEISSRYPAYITQRQMIEICGVYKSIVYKAERSGVVPFEKAVNHLLHTHRINLMDALAFKYRREYGYRRDDDYISYLKRFYASRLSRHPDVLRVSDVAEI